MSAYRTAKVGEAFYSILTVFDADGITPVSGEMEGDFDVRFSYNGVAQTGVVFDVSEVGTTGDYVIAVPGGFPTAGLWVITAEVAHNGSTWRDEVEIRTRDIVDVYNLVLAGAGGGGGELVELTLVDTVNGDAPVPDARVDIYDSTSSVFVTFQRTDVSGVASVFLDPGTYTARIFKPGVSVVDQLFEVVDTGGLTPQEFELECESVLAPPPASPHLCRLYADFISLDGLPFENFKLSVENLYDPVASQGLAVVEKSRQYVTDAAGHVEFDVVRGTKVRVTFVTSPLARKIRVPDQPVVNLLTAMGSATSVFQVVRR